MVGEEKAYSWLIGQKGSLIVCKTSYWGSLIYCILLVYKYDVWLLVPSNSSMLRFVSTHTHMHRGFECRGNHLQSMKRCELTWLLWQANHDGKWDPKSGRHTPKPSPAELLAAESWPIATSLRASFEKVWHHFGELLHSVTEKKVFACETSQFLSSATATSSSCTDLAAFNEQKDVKFMCPHSLLNNITEQKAA